MKSRGLTFQTVVFVTHPLCTRFIHGVLVERKRTRHIYHCFKSYNGEASYFCHIKTNIFNGANPQHSVPTQSDMPESKLQRLYIYICTKFDNCALSLNSSGKFKRMVIAGLRQTEHKTGSQNWKYERSI